MLVRSEVIDIFDEVTDEHILVVAQLVFFCSLKITQHLGFVSLHLATFEFAAHCLVWITHQSGEPPCTCRPKPEILYAAAVGLSIEGGGDGEDKAKDKLRLPVACRRRHFQIGHGLVDLVIIIIDASQLVIEPCIVGIVGDRRQAGGDAFWVFHVACGYTGGDSIRIQWVGNQSVAFCQFMRLANGCGQQAQQD